MEESCHIRWPKIPVCVSGQHEKEKGERTPLRHLPRVRGCAKALHTFAHETLKTALEASIFPHQRWENWGVKVNNTLPEVTSYKTEELCEWQMAPLKSSWLKAEERHLRGPNTKPTPSWNKATPGRWWKGSTWGGGFDTAETTQSTASFSLTRGVVWVPFCQNTSPQMQRLEPTEYILQLREAIAWIESYGTTRRVSVGLPPSGGSFRCELSPGQFLVSHSNFWLPSPPAVNDAWRDAIGTHPDNPGRSSHLKMLPFSTWPSSLCSSVLYFIGL